jgi:WD40 repeat protein
MLLSTAENIVNQWDLRKDEIVNQANPIQGSINKLITDGNYMRLFTICQNETFIKVLDLQTLKNLYTVKFNKEITCFDISGDMNRYAVGFTNGEVSIKSRSTVEDEENVLDQEQKDLDLLE